MKMNSKEIRVPKKLIYGIGIGIGILIVLYLINTKFSAFNFGRSTSTSNGTPRDNSSKLVAGTVEKFAFLSGQTGQRSVPNECGLLPAVVEGMPGDGSIQGSCCSPMDFPTYQGQIEGLKKYANMPQVPGDPYDIPVSLAKQLFEYQKTIQLSSTEQADYDQAMQMTDQKGPCCCHCWRWDAMEGQTKYLISQLHWSPKDIATLLNLEEGCGGPGSQHSQAP
jgi:hypothetical protein